MISDELNKFIIGSLLHDIGKFKQRAQYPEDKGKTHSVIGYEWLISQYGEGLIAAAARNHHGSEPETWKSNLSLIIYEADNLAASERKEYDFKLDVEQTWQPEVYLACEFSWLSSVEKAQGDSLKPKYWPLMPLGGWIEPQETGKGRGSEEYRTLWESFEREFDTMKARATHLSIDHLLLLLEKYTSFVPSITLQIISSTDEATFRKHPDVSLFDHLRVTAGAATCLYQYICSRWANRWSQEVLKEEITSDWDRSEEQPFLMVGGDLSGVQKFIYTISSKGALKSLKGRSFFLEVFTEYVIDRILEEGQLSRCNVLFTGGGHFYILGSNTEAFVQTLIRIRKEVNDYLFGAFNGELFQCLEWVQMAKRDFRDATSLWSAVSAKLEASKKRKWEEHLDLVLGEPTMPVDDCLTKKCEVCGREDQPLTPGEVPMCPFCYDQFEFGSKLQRFCRDQMGAKRSNVGIAAWDSLPGQAARAFSIGAEGYRRYYEVVSLDGDLVPNKGLVARYRINDWAPGNYDTLDRPLLAGVYHDPFFEDLETSVQNGFGIGRAAVLRMDVDNLGRMFSTGLSEGDRTFSRKASLSRQFSLFFKYHINGILDIDKKDGYESLLRIDSAGRSEVGMRTGRALSLVYAGGDDVFIIGQWLDCLEAAFDVNEAFHRFTGNPGITLSGGFALGDVHLPVYRFADDSGKAVARAKANGRDAIDFLGGTFRWSESEEVIRLMRREILPLLTMGASCLEVPTGSFAKGFLYRLLALIRSHAKEKEWVLPKAAYLAGRNGPALNWLEKNGGAREAWMALRDRLFSLRDEGHRKLETALVWTLMMLRKGGE